MSDHKVLTRQEKLLNGALRLLTAAIPVSNDPSMLSWCVANDVLKDIAVDRLEQIIAYGTLLLEGGDPEPIESEAVEIPRVVIMTAQIIIIKVVAEDASADVTGNAMDRWSIA